MTGRVRMQHPDLPGQAIYVRPSAVATHAASGWHEAPEPPPPRPQGQQPTSRRRRAVSTEEDTADADAAAQPN